MARWKAHCPLLFVIIELCSLALTVTAEALVSEMCRNRRFLKRWVTLSANFKWMETSPASHMGYHAALFA